MFISFEGPEGAGKSTQISLTAEALESNHLAVVVTREPGGTQLGESIRTLLLDTHFEMSPETEAYLMTAARAEHVRKVIRPALSADKIVLTDRFMDSTLAYQGGGRGLSSSDLRCLQELAVGNTVPDLRILLDIDVKKGLIRKNRDLQRLNRIDMESIEFHERVAAWYRSEAARLPNDWIVVDADQSTGSVFSEVLSGLVTRLKVDINLHESSLM